MNRRKFQVHRRVESGGAPPHSKTLARWLREPKAPPAFRVRRCYGALDFPRGSRS